MNLDRRQIIDYLLEQSGFDFEFSSIKDVVVLMTKAYDFGQASNKQRMSLKDAQQLIDNTLLANRGKGAISEGSEMYIREDVVLDIIKKITR